jgi:DNA repair exonuclease SbcCD nuclease subunit
MIFNKAAVITDIHFGRRSNDKQANLDNLDFLCWFIDKAKRWGAETCMMMGDWHDNRHSLHVSTLNYSLQGMQMLNDAFKRVFFISGNHDLYFRERRDLSSIEFGKLLPNITLVNEPLTVDDVTFLPWLIGDEAKQMRQLKSRYIFGHLEVPGFKMNQMVEMPDHGGLNAKSFPNQEYVYSGHFHLRQARENVVYIGNAFPFTYSDAWDSDRGCMLLEWGKEPRFEAWPEQPLFRTTTLSALVAEPEKFLCEKASVRVSLDLDLTFEEATYLRDNLVAQYGARRIDLVNVAKQEAESEFDAAVQFRSIDQMVIEGLSAVESVGMDPGLLIEVYKSLA